MSEVATTLMEQVDAIALAMVAGYRVRIPGYAALLERNREDVFTVSRVSALVFLRLIMEDRDIEPAEMVILRAAGRRRAELGVPLEAVLQAYSLGREIAWEYISKACQDAGVEEEEIYRTTLQMARFIEAVTLAVTQEYLVHVTTAYQEEHRRLNALVDLVKAINRSLDLDEVINVGLAQTRAALAVEWAAIWLVDLERGVLRLHQQQLGDPWTGNAGATGELLEIKLGAPGIGRAVIEGSELIITGDALPEVARRHGCGLVALVPMLHREQSLGMLGVASHGRAALTEKEHDFLLTISDQLAVSVSQVQEHIREARTDFLTGLANRHEFDRFLRHELSRAERFSTPLALALLDVDGLKVVNDTHGHRAGDEALRLIGSTLRKSVRSLDLAARIGGDEFAIVMPQTTEEFAQEVVKRVQDAIGELRLKAGSGVSVSVGVIGWQRGQPIEDFIAVADRHLYDDKRLAPRSPVAGDP